MERYSHASVKCVTSFFIWYIKKTFAHIQPGSIYPDSHSKHDLNKLSAVDLIVTKQLTIELRIDCYCLHQKHTNNRRLFIQTQRAISSEEFKSADPAG